MRNIVHLPFYLQNSGFRKVPIAQQLASITFHASSSYRNKTWLEIDDQAAHLHRRPSTESANNKFSKRRESSRFPTRKNSFGSMSSIASKFKHQLAGQSNSFNPVHTDITKMIATDDYMSDVNVRSMRRLMNVVYVMSRLMRAFHIDFNYSHLATWVHITEQWPYRLSWIVFYVEMAAEQHSSEADLDHTKSLYEIYTRVKSTLRPAPYLNDLDIDRDEKKLEAILKTKQHAMTIKELKIFVPFSINLDPYLKKVIRDEYVKNDLAWFKNESTKLQKLPRKFAQDLEEESEKDDLLLELPSPIRLSKETLEKSLSQKSVDEICALVRQIEGLKSSCVDTYCDAIVSQNISGAVLARCNLQELKSVLNMNFGDWEIFQWTLDCLRQLDVKHRERRSASAKVRNIMMAPSVLIEQQANSSKLALPEDAKYIDSANAMDEALISGLLSTLNEDAHEDVVTEELMEKRQRQQSECESLYEAADSDVIYFTKSRVGDRAMSISIGSEDAFNALEKGVGSENKFPSVHLVYSQTAPASPMLGRSRTSSVQKQPPETSVERLGDKMRSVKKSLKHAMHKMDQPTTLPPVHRAREKSDSSERKSISSMTSKKGGSKSQGASREESIHGSIELPIFGDVPDNDDEQNVNSSPEQETVMPKESARPRVENLFQ